MAVGLRAARGAGGMRAGGRLVRVRTTALAAAAAAAAAVAARRTGTLLLLLFLLLLIGLFFLFSLGNGRLNPFTGGLIRFLPVNFGRVPTKVVRDFEEFEVGNQFLPGRLERIDEISKSLGLFVLTNGHIQRPKISNNLLLGQNGPGHCRGLLLDRTLVGSGSLGHFPILGMTT